jgi:stress response protein SCP2
LETDQQPKKLAPHSHEAFSVREKDMSSFIVSSQPFKQSRTHEYSYSQLKKSHGAVVWEKCNLTSAG